MKLKCFLVRDVLLHHGDKAVKVTQDCIAEVEFPSTLTDDDLSRGVWQNKETRGEWRISHVVNNGE